MDTNQPPSQPDHSDQADHSAPDPGEDAFTAAEMTRLLVGLVSAIRGVDPADLPEEARARIARAVAARVAKDDQVTEEGGMEP